VSDSSYKTISKYGVGRWRVPSMVKLRSTTRIPKKMMQQQASLQKRFNCHKRYGRNTFQGPEVNMGDPPGEGARKIQVQRKVK
jgi:hypothetical protein